jgi:hypothetical protein
MFQSIKHLYRETLYALDGEIGHVWDLAFSPENSLTTMLIAADWIIPIATSYSDLTLSARAGRPNLFMVCAICSYG